MVYDYSWNEDHPENGLNALVFKVYELSEPLCIKSKGAVGYYLMIGYKWCRHEPSLGNDQDKELERSELKLKIERSCRG